MGKGRRGGGKEEGRRRGGREIEILNDKWKGKEEEEG